MPSDAAILLLVGISWGSKVQPSVAFSSLGLTSGALPAQQRSCHGPGRALKTFGASGRHGTACNRRATGLCSLLCKKVEGHFGAEVVTERLNKETEKEKGMSPNHTRGCKGRVMQRARLWVGPSLVDGGVGGPSKTASVRAVGKVRAPSCCAPLFSTISSDGVESPYTRSCR